MPRYIWVVDQYLCKASIFPKGRDIVASFFFDATDLENSDFLMKVVHYNPEAYIFNKISLDLSRQKHGDADTPYIIRILTECYLKNKSEKIIIAPGQ